LTINLQLAILTIKLLQRRLVAEDLGEIMSLADKPGAVTRPHRSQDYAALFFLRESILTAMHKKKAHFNNNHWLFPAKNIYLISVARMTYQPSHRW